MTGLCPVRERNRTLCSAPENVSHFDPSRKIPAHAEAEDTSKIKDRLEALLFAETLQGTLSPNCLLYQSECSLRKWRIKKVTGGEAEGFLWAIEPFSGAEEFLL